MDYTLIEDSALLMEKLASWQGLDRIAVDFEGEFNLHIYGEHLCLIQIFDGSSYYIIDPRSSRISKDALLSFFSSPVKKVWFDCQSDNSLVFKKYGVGVENILDVRVYAMALGYMTNLVSLEKEFLGVETFIEPGEKKKLQQTNWTKRPLTREQLEYALSDVAHLFELEDVLYQKVVEAGLEKECAYRMKDRQKTSAGKPGWVTLGDWRRMNRQQRECVKQYYIARDAVARRFNVPAYYVLDKHVLLHFALSCPDSESEVRLLVKKANVRFQSQLEESMLKAFSLLHRQ